MVEKHSSVEVGSGYITKIVISECIVGEKAK